MYLCVHTCSKGSYSPSRTIYSHVSAYRPLLTWPHIHPHVHTNTLSFTALLPRYATTHCTISLPTLYHVYPSVAVDAVTHTHTAYFSECGVCSACEPLIAYASWIERSKVFSYTVFSVPIFLWNSRNDCTAVGLSVDQGGPLCMHPSWSIRAAPGPHHIHEVLSCPALYCPRWVRAVSRLSLYYVTAHGTLPNPDLIYRTLPATVPCPSSSV